MMSEASIILGSLLKTVIPGGNWEVGVGVSVRFRRCWNSTRFGIDSGSVIRTSREILLKDGDFLKMTVGDGVNRESAG